LTGTESRSEGGAAISGAGSGIGRAVAVALGARGLWVALLGRTEASLEAALSEVREAGGDGAVFVCDVRDTEAVDAAAEALIAQRGAPSIVVPAAGVLAVAPVEELPPEAFRDVVETNLLGTYHLIRSFLPAMKGAGGGRLVPILSVAATRGFPTWSAYCASKWGVRGLVASLREELAGSGVTITAVYPGATDTDLWDDVPGEWDRSKMVPVEEVGRAVLHALETPEPALVEEIHVGPAGGAL
jgi:NAD(P)-dependent dehydrogenase (short-subunit alcohol dehydrogenase family)